MKSRHMPGQVGSTGPEAGFSLTELLVVLAIMALLVAIVAPNMIGRLGGARSQTARVQIENLAGALDIYQIDTGHYPETASGLGALVSAPDGEPRWAGPYLGRGGVPEDPWGQAYIYRSDGPDHFEIKTLGRDGADGGTGEDADIVTTSVELNEAGASGG